MSEFFYKKVELPADSYFMSLPQEKVATAEGIRCFGILLHVKPLDDLEQKIAEYIPELSRRLDNAARSILWSLYPVGQRGKLPTESTEGYVEVHVTPEMEDLHPFPEGGLPSAEPAVVRYGGDWTIYVPRDEITVRLLAGPMWMELARINSQRRILLMLYFNIERKEDNQ